MGLPGTNSTVPSPFGLHMMCIGMVRFVFIQ